LFDAIGNGGCDSGCSSCASAVCDTDWRHPSNFRIAD
jgi:hypothetical protein